MKEATPTENRLIVALDKPSFSEAFEIVDALAEEVGVYKVGMELAYAAGLDVVKALVQREKKVFLDLKLHDVPNTVFSATRVLRDVGAAYLTVHAYPQTLRAAIEAARGSALKILGVTALTSMDDQDLEQAGYRFGVTDLVARRAEQILTAGAYGVVCSAQDLSSLKPALIANLAVFTPGVRPKGADYQDQKRVMTPSEAIFSGADYLILGRAVTQAHDPRRAGQEIRRQIEGALEKRKSS